MAPACKTAASEPVPAVLVEAGDEEMAAMKTVLAQAVGRAEVSLGPGDPTRSPKISVLPPPLGPNETRSPAQPAQFQLMMAGGACMLVNQKTGETHALDMPCTPADL
ncbi:MAG: hypothetical protein AAGH87_06860 [Pseudomonadota bacterium]